MAPVRLRILLFLSGYCPMLLISSIFFFPKNILIMLICGAITLISFLSLWLYLEHGTQKQDLSVSLRTSRRCKRNIISSSVTYLLPFATLHLDTWEQITILALFLVLVAVLSLRFNMISLNPLFLFLGYRLFAITIEGDEQRRYCLAGRRLIKGERLYYAPLDDGHWVETSPQAKKGRNDVPASHDTMLSLEK